MIIMGKPLYINCTEAQTGKDVSGQQSSQLGSEGKGKWLFFPGICLFGSTVREIRPTSNTLLI